MTVSAPARWVLGGTLLAWAWMAAPALRETRLDPGEREAWRREILVVDPAQVAAFLAAGDRRIVILDIREAPEFARDHVPTALNVPLRDVPGMDLADCLQADLVIPYCLKDLRGFEAARVLRERGVPNVALFEGFGLAGWSDAANLPLAGARSGMDDAAVLEKLKGFGADSSLEGIR